MKRLICMLITCLPLSFIFLVPSSAEFSANKNPNNTTKNTNNNGVYIVYMGAAAQTNEVHAQLVASLTESDALVHSYTSGFSGFAARLTEEEARAIARRPGVVSIFPDPVLHTHTTRSWDFLESFSPPPQSPLSSSSSTSSPSPDTIIGFLDTGIWPESPSFNDYGMGPIPPRWKGMCQDGYDFNASLSCNRKIIGARYYKSRGVGRSGTPRDHYGHGTHVASTAAGSLVEGASYHGVASGMARGGSPSSRIAMYKVCNENGICMGSDILKGFDDAIKDGVDVLSVSLGGGAGGETKPDFVKDPVAFGSFHAVERGIVVVCATGNSGPLPASVDNEAPWVLSVAASTLDRRFESTIVLGRRNKVIIEGGGIHFGRLRKRAAYGLVTGAMAKKSNASESFARACFPSTLDPAKVKGRIVVCEEEYFLAAEVVKALGGVGIIQVVGNDDLLMAPQYEALSGSAISQSQAAQIFTYLSSTKDPVATILPTVTTIGNKPAPVVIYFSSRGPARASVSLLKPDITAPGVDILAAWPSPGKKLPSYNIISGTSMSCPHASGVVATVKARHPTFSASAIKSAVMTTATQTNNMDAPITTSYGLTATPYDIGAGQLNPTSALDPGLVYETQTEDYVTFLCATGYNTSQIRLISSTVPKHFRCPEDSSPEASISNVNYPSIAVSKLKKGETRTVTRTATNVGDDEDAVYVATVEAMTGIEVGVSPNTLVFNGERKTVSYRVSLTATASMEKDVFGSITWSNGKYNARSPIVVSYESVYGH